MALKNQRRSLTKLLTDVNQSISTSEAIAKWEQQTGKSAQQAKEMMLNGFYPPINVMDSSIEKLLHCEKLSLSTNMIDKIAHLNGLRHLKILSLGRNLLSNLLPLEAISETLEELWVSYNSIQKFDGILTMKKLRVLYIGNNQIKDWSEIRRLSSIVTLEDIVLYENPIYEEYRRDEDAWLERIQKLLKSLKKIDGIFLKQDLDI